MKIEQIVIFKLTDQKAMILKSFVLGEAFIYGTNDPGYLIRLDDLREVFVRDFEIEEYVNGEPKPDDEIIKGM